MNEINTAKLEELQRKVANREATAEDEQEMWELTNKVAKERGMPTTEAGVIGDADHDQTPDKDEDENESHSSRPVGRRMGVQPAATTTQNVNRKG